MLTRLATTFTVAMALAASPLLADNHKESTDFHKSAQVSSLMERVQSNALDMREQAARLRMYNRTPQMHSWKLHADELNRIAGGLDNIAGLIGELEPLKPYMTLRQAAAFNHLVTLSAEAADVSEGAIHIVNTEREKLRVAHPDYETKVEAIYDHADMIAAHADSVEDWAEFIEEMSESSDD